MENTFQTGVSSTVISIGAPSFSAGSSFDTLDFSLPSYDEATKGGDISSTSKSAPAFTADFPELKLPREEAKKETSVDEAAAKKASEDEKAAKAKVGLFWYCMIRIVYRHFNVHVNSQMYLWIYPIPLGKGRGTSSKRKGGSRKGSCRREEKGRISCS
jgi:hypothetical protein